MRGTIRARMDAFDLIAERRITEAVAAGAFDRLPGAGRPLEIEDASAIPEELRAGYLLLRSAGVLPEELTLRKELLTLADLLRACTDPAERQSLEERRRLVLLKHDVLLERARLELDLTRRKIEQSHARDGEEAPRGH